MRKQKFHRGDLVKIADDLGPTMPHFAAGIEAIVLGSYADLYGGAENSASYSLHLGPEKGPCSWYYESQLTLIERGSHDLLKQWETLEREREELAEDLDWIFRNGPRMLAEQKFHDGTLQKLFTMLGGGDIWGPRGEGFDYYANAQIAISHAMPYLSRGDRAGWEVYCERVTSRA